MVEDSIERLLDCLEVGRKMVAEGLSSHFIYRVFQAALKNQNTYDLMMTWFEESDDKKKSHIIFDLVETLNDPNLRGKK